MGGLGPGIGGFEVLVIGIVALLVVGPKDLPVLMRRVGQFMAKARGMANEFRASFDEMARQSELDDLRKEVDALRRGQGVYALGDEATAAFKDINDDLSRPLDASASPVATGRSEWPDAEPVMAPLEPQPEPTPTPRQRKASPKAKPARPATKSAAKAPAKTARKPTKSAAPKTTRASVKPATKTPRARARSKTSS
ncbi:MAG: twin-arginine translocase subunit TatB [Brevundimonas sp.]|uniref:Sec-independent protein translocase protein TatB n=1 Tax=Brevundimonas sp. TaxID=1871086 RepID=UPI00120592A5|nr:Sec-independent protein translocase protein TatB [Brevundimonas sp.]RZJ17526.1 MAG: twin-arginine translocase subunit TatB [Brevundimonas sp.]